jgi:MFS transporter, putative metabolite:H+ symporter
VGLFLRRSQNDPDLTFKELNPRKSDYRAPINRRDEMKPEDNQKLTPEAWKILIFVMVAWIFDAADGTIYALTLPMIREEFHLSLAQMGGIGSVFLAGAVVGSALIPLLADKKGRRWGMVTCISLYSLFSGFTGLAQNLSQISIARFFTGCGTGGEWPIGAAYLSEVVPAKKRGFAMGLMQAGYPIGYFLAGAIFAVLISWNFGWRSCFYVLVIPAILCIWVLKSLRESDRWQQERQKGQTEQKRISYAELFRPEYRKFTVIGTLLHVFGGFWSWGLIIWFPTILMLDFHIEKIMSSYITMYMWGIAIIGYICAGPISDKIGRKRSMLFFATTCLFSVCILYYLKATSVVSMPAIYTIATILGWGMGVYTILIGYSSEIFPSHVRSLGIGFSVGVGKVAAMAAPLLIGIIAQTYSVTTGLLVAVIVGWMMVPTIFCGPETAGKRLEDIIPVAGKSTAD